MKKSDRLLREEAFVVKELGDRNICYRCLAKLASYPMRCTAELSEPCPGFRAIEDVRAKFTEIERRSR